MKKILMTIVAAAGIIFAPAMAAKADGGGSSGGADQSKSCSGTNCSDFFSIGSKDVYSGTYRLGRLIGMDITSECKSSRLEFDKKIENSGLFGLVESSTGYWIHLCIGATFDSGDAGQQFTPAAVLYGDGLRAEYNTVYYKTTDCSGPAYLYVPRALGGVLSSGFFGNTDSVGNFTPLMGHPRVFVIKGRDGKGVLVQASSKKEAFSPLSYSQYPGPPGCAATPDSGFAVDSNPAFVRIVKNDPSVTGITNDLTTPFTLKNSR